MFLVSHEIEPENECIGISDNYIFQRLRIMVFLSAAVALGVLGDY